jgi:hypothetical protein
MVALPMATTQLLLCNGDRLEVVGEVGEVAKALENAARSTSGTLAWLTEEATRKQVGVNAAQVATVSAGES